LIGEGFGDLLAKRRKFGDGFSVIVGRSVFGGLTHLIIYRLKLSIMIAGRMYYLFRRGLKRECKTNIMVIISIL
jgi:hypothetical protein